MPEISLRTSMISMPDRVDRENGIIRRVPIITKGVTKPSSGELGSPFDIDDITLQQAAAVLNAVDKTKSRVTHPEATGEDGITKRVGNFKNAVVEGDKVYADFYFGSYATEDSKVMLCGLVEEEPHDVGVSIVSATATVEPDPTAQTGMVLRLTQIDAIDWTDDPAANPAGMLSATKKIQLKEKTMNEKQRDFLRSVGLPWEATDEQTADFINALSDDQKAQFAALKESEEVEAAAEAAESSAGATSTTPAVEATEEEDETASGMTASANTPAPQVALSTDPDKVRKAERARINEIHQIALKCGHDTAWANQYINNGTAIGEVRRIALSSLNRGPNDMPTSNVQVGSDLNRESINQAVQHALMLRAGVRKFVKFNQSGGVCLSANQTPEIITPHERADQFRGHTLVEMGRRYLLALGYRQADSMNKTQLVALLMNKSRLRDALSGVFLSQSTGDFTYLLADTMGKVLRAQYALAPHTWQAFCRRTTAPDFKDIKPMQLSEAADLEEIPEGDEYTYAGLSESREVYRLSTFGKGIKFTRQMMINDDLRAFDIVPTRLANAAARKLEVLGNSVITTNAALADGIALFHADHGNLATGTLSVTSLGAARAKMRRQTALGSDDPLELTPAILYVPETIRTLAEQLVYSTVDPAKSNAANNPFSNTLQVVPSARLDADSTTQWYLFASYDEIDTVEMAFLEGEESPVVEEEDEFDTDCRKVKVRQNAAAKAIDYKGMVRSDGVDA